MNENQRKVKLFLMVVGFNWLLGCSEPASKSAPELSDKESNSNVIATQTIDKKLQYIPATKIPTTDRLRKQQLAEISKAAATDFEKQRLALFIRFTLLANSKKPELEALERIIQELTTLTLAHPADIELSALLGSATSFQSIFYPEDSGKQRLLAKKGIRLMDRAIRRSPEHLGVRLQRGISYAAMPAFLGKARYAVDDLSIIKSASNSDESHFIAMIDFYLGKALINNQQVQQGVALLQLLAERNLTPWSQQASDLIKEKGE